MEYEEKYKAKQSITVQCSMLVPVSAQIESGYLQ
jgi:hypothetical protein